MQTRYFVNAPALPDLAAVERYAADLGAIGLAGYTADIGEYRACLEISGEAALEWMDAEARRIERAAKALREVAEKGDRT